MNLLNSKVAVIGLGYVGLPLAIEFGKYIDTIGYDINPIRVNELKSGVDNTLECTHSELSEARYLEYTSDFDALKVAKTYVVTVPTPVDDANRPDMRPLIKASEMVGAVIKNGDVVIFESTVYPGATEEVCVPVIERVSGMKYNKDFFCGYSPERINPGDKKNTLTKICKITSGSNTQVAQAVDELYKKIIHAGTWMASSIKVAEAAKVIENSQRDLNIAFVNELSVIFDLIGIDTLEVLEAAGSKWNFMPFRPGMVGGHCIGVDPYYLTHKAEELGYHPQVILAGRRINDDMSKIAAQKIIKMMLKNKINVADSVIGILGITFKENCPDIRNSKIVDLIRELEAWGAKVQVCDPWANSQEVHHQYGIPLCKMSDLANVDSLVVAVGHIEFRRLTSVELRNCCKPSVNPVLGDLKGLYTKDDLLEQGFSVYRM